ncbi:hypothetical protein IQ250_10945 [Pseudanabaenaceae cyanobacterium LEGE 13415]|nr:hypothetical protein [Pseudanabaenaceae cyanobacterium LEGE 13415]
MTAINYHEMDLDELRQYVLTYREDIAAFHVYVDRSKAAGRMITINVGDPDWKAKLDEKLLHHPSLNPDGYQPPA